MKPWRREQERERGHKTALVLSLCYLLLALSTIGESNGSDIECGKACLSRSGLSVHFLSPVYLSSNVSSHWYEVSRGVLEAAKVMKVEAKLWEPFGGNLSIVESSSNLSSSREAQEMIVQNTLARLSREIDAVRNILIVPILATEGSPSILGKLDALSANWTIVTVGSYGDWTTSKRLHIGVNDTEVGYSAGFSAGMKVSTSSLLTGICVRDSALDLSESLICRGYGRGLKAACDKQAMVCDSRVFTGEQAALALANMTEMMRKDKRIVHIFSVGEKSQHLVENALSARGLKTPGEEGPSTESPIFLTSLGSIAAHKARTSSQKLFETIDTQPYLQGYLSVALSVYRLTRGFRPSMRVIRSGPRSSLSKRGVGWALSRPQDLDITMVTHGYPTNDFWKIVSAGVELAAHDLGLGLNCTAPRVDGGGSFNCPGQGKLNYLITSNVFDVKDMAEKVERAVAESRGTSGIILSIPSVDGLKDAIKLADKSSIPMVSINSGYEAIGKLQVDRLVVHVGQNEYQAGKRSGEVFLTQHPETTSTLCLIHELGNTALDQRCQGYQDGLIAKKKTAYWSEVFVNGSSPDPVAGLNQRMNKLGAENLTVTGILSATSALFGTLSADDKVFKDLTNGRRMATFDVDDDILRRLKKNEVTFAVDQQGHMQGWLSVHLMHLLLVSGLFPLDSIISTGPEFLDGSDLEKKSEEEKADYFNFLFCRHKPNCPFPKEQCAMESWRGDGWCDEVNNNAACGYDGGDCCESTCLEREKAIGSGGGKRLFKCGTSHGNGTRNAYLCTDPKSFENTQKPTSAQVRRPDSLNLLPIYVFIAIVITVLFFIIRALRLDRQEKEAFERDLETVTEGKNSLQTPACSDQICTPGPSPSEQFSGRSSTEDFRQYMQDLEAASDVDDEGDGFTSSGPAHQASALPSEAELSSLTLLWSSRPEGRSERASLD